MENNEKEILVEENNNVNEEVKDASDIISSFREDIESLKANTEGGSLEHLFDNLSSDIASVNKFITDLNDKKKANHVEEKELVEERERLDKTKKDFEAYMDAQKEEIVKKQQQVDEYLENQKQYLAKAEAEFKDNMDSSLAELEISKKELELQQQKLQEEKEQFENYKSLEINRIHHAEEILTSERNQFEKYKEVTNQKIELDNKNLEQKCNRFKEIVGQFNSNFKPILDEKSE